MQISQRLSVEGPDKDGDYELTLIDCGCDDGQHWHYLTRAEADALIAALQPVAPAEIVPQESYPSGGQPENRTQRQPLSALDPSPAAVQARHLAEFGKL